MKRFSKDNLVEMNKIKQKIEKLEKTRYRTEKEKFCFFPIKILIFYSTRNEKEEILKQMIEVNDELVNKMKKESSGSDFKNSIKQIN